MACKRSGVRIPVAPLQGGSGGLLRVVQAHWDEDRARCSPDVVTMSLVGIVNCSAASARCSIEVTNPVTTARDSWATWAFAELRSHGLLQAERWARAQVLVCRAGNTVRCTVPVFRSK